MTGKKAAKKKPGRKPGSRNPPIQSADLLMRENRALALIEQNLNYAQIAKELGYANAAGAWKAVHRALARERSDRAEAVRTIELRRFDKRDRKLWTIFLNPKTPAQTVLRAHESLNQTSDRRARLLGLNALPVELKLDQAIQAYERDVLDVVRANVQPETFDRIAAALARLGGVGGSGEGESAGAPTESGDDSADRPG